MLAAGKDVNGKDLFVGRAQKKAEREAMLRAKCALGSGPCLQRISFPRTFPRTCLLVPTLDSLFRLPPGCAGLRSCARSASPSTRA